MSPHFVPARLQHEDSRLRTPGLEGSSKISVSRSFSGPTCFSFAPTSPLFKGESYISLWGQFRDKEGSSSLLEGNEERFDSEGWVSGWGRFGV